MLRFSRFYGHSVLCNPLHADSVVVDLGTNRAAFATAIWKTFGCKPYCAEPNPHLYEELTCNPGLRAFNVAIGPRSGRVCFHVAQNDECSSLVAPTASTVVSQIECEALTLPDFLDRIGIERVNLLKVDIEGAELDFLANAQSSLLGRIDQITVEFHEAIGLGTIEDVRKRIRRLESFGFHAFKGSFTDFSDVLFVHPDRLGLGTGWAWQANAWRLFNGVERRVRRIRKQQGIHPSPAQS